MISNLDLIKNKKNLLAFSAGTDSSALFHKLNSLDITFDIIFIKYNFRPEDSILELNHVNKLKNLFPDKQFFIFECEEVFQSNIESKARTFRHELFEKIIFEYNYENLITGHNLNDRFEWLLMQLAKGSSNLIGMTFNDYKFSVKYDFSFNIIRPFINTSKEDINSYLADNNIIHFKDSSNDLNCYTRNKIRNNFSNEFIRENTKGIKLSFQLLEKEQSEVASFSFKFKDSKKDFFILNINSPILLLADRFLKSFGYVLSISQRETFLNKKELTLTINSKLYVLSFNDLFLFFTPYLDRISLSKDFKSLARQFHIPIKNRSYVFLYQESEKTPFFIHKLFAC